MKHEITNRDIDEPVETKAVEAVELDLQTLEESLKEVRPDFSSLIAQAASQAAIEQEAQDKLHIAKAMLAEGVKALKDKVARETGHTVGHGDLWVFKPKPKSAYGLWKRVIPLFVQSPEFLDLGPTELAKRLDANEANFTVKRDMIYDPLNDYAVKDLKRLLKKLGVTLKLKAPVTIRSIQLQLIERRDAALALEVEEFSGHFVLRGDKAYINGKPYKIQLGSSGQRRIQYGRRWLPLEVLKEICIATAG